MDYYSVNRKEEQRDRIKSGIITAIIWACLLLFVFLYKVTTVIPRQDEVVSAMLINFGDNRNGSGEEEPAEQEGSQAAVTELRSPEQPAQPQEPSPEPKTEIKKNNSADRVLTGNDAKNAVKKTDKKENTTKAASAKTSTAPKSTAPKNAKTSAENANAATGTGDGKGNAAIGNLIKGRGTKAGGQGTGTGIGNAGDPLGGEGNGDSRIGVDRKLVSFIPGTMGRGGAQPTHSCSASGSITISYTVDKAGNVVSATRSGGSSDPCLVSTSVSWVKKYVKAERAGFSSTGSYRITF